MNDCFEKTLFAVNEMRLLLTERLAQLLACNQTTKTVKSLDALLQLVEQIKVCVKLHYLDKATKIVEQIAANGFVDASRVLKGADHSILNRGQFMSQATQRLVAIRSALASDWIDCHGRHEVHTTTDIEDLFQ